MLTLADVIEGLCDPTRSIETRPEALKQPISTTVVDSRRAEPGALFISLKGEHADGHDYVADAFSRGAVAAIVERDVEVGDLTLDLTGPDPKSQISDLEPQIPLLIKVDDSLQALHRAATFWRQQHDLIYVNPNAWGYFPLTALFSILFASKCTAQERRPKAVLWLLASVNFVWVILTGSRQCMLVGVCCMMYLICQIPGRFRRVTWTSGACLVGILCASLFSDRLEYARSRVEN